MSKREGNPFHALMEHTSRWADQQLDNQLNVLIEGVHCLLREDIGGHWAHIGQVREDFTAVVPSKMKKEG